MKQMSVNVKIYFKRKTNYFKKFGSVHWMIKGETVRVKALLVDTELTFLYFQACQKHEQIRKASIHTRKVKGDLKDYFIHIHT